MAIAAHDEDMIPNARILLRHAKIVFAGEYHRPGRAAQFIMWFVLRASSGGCPPTYGSSPLPILTARSCAAIIA